MFFKYYLPALFEMVASIFNNLAKCSEIVIAHKPVSIHSFLLSHPAVQFLGHTLHMSFF